MKRNEVRNYVMILLAGLSDEQLADRTTCITLMSVKIQRQFPNLYRESRRAIAARCITRELKRRRIK